MLRARFLGWACGLAFLPPPNVPAAPPKILEFRTQEVGPHVYFHVDSSDPTISDSPSISGGSARPRSCCDCRG